MPELPPDTHPTARKWFESLAESGQSVFFQASDWATAVVAAELLSEQLLSSRPNAQMVGVWASISSALLCTEGDRRRMRIELSKPAPEGEEAADVSDLTAYRERIARESS